MRRFIVFGLIACFAALLVLPLAGCKGSTANNTGRPSTTTGNSNSSGTDDSSGGSLGGNKKAIDKELGN